MASVLLLVLTSAATVAKAKDERIAAATTVFTASENSYVDFSIPAEAKLSLGWNEEGRDVKGVGFSGGRGFAALVIRPLSSDANLRTYTVVRLPSNKERPDNVFALGPDLCVLQDFCALEPGRYRAFVVTDRRLSIEVSFTGLSRAATTLRAQNDAAAEVLEQDLSSVQEVPYTVTGAEMYRAGFFDEIESDEGMMFYAIWLSGPDDNSNPDIDEPILQVGDSGMCGYEGEANAEIAFAPGCPGGNYLGGVTSLRESDSHHYEQWGQHVGLPSGLWGFGGFAVHTQIRHEGVAGFRLDFN